MLANVEVANAHPDGLSRWQHHLGSPAQAAWLVDAGHTLRGLGFGLISHHACRMGSDLRCAGLCRSDMHEIFCSDAQ